MEKSFVGDPIFWPGLIYAPLNMAGLLFAFGSMAQATGLVFEEFCSDNTAYCRRKTDKGWEKMKVAFALKSSEYDFTRHDVDLLVCWHDDAAIPNGIAKQILSQYVSTPITLSGPASARNRVEDILADDAVESLSSRARNHENFEETVKQLDNQIKKLQGR